jgi:hypothetical protein
MLHCRFPIFLACATLALLHAQENGIRGPVSAFVFDSASRGIRPILGVPGAALLGDVVAGNLDWASVAPNAKWALAAQSGQLVFLSGLDSSATATLISPILACCDLAAWGADSKTAALYSASSQQLFLVTSLDTSPLISAHDLPPLAGDVRFLLVDGNSLFFGVEGSGVYGLAETGTSRLLAPLDHPRAATFLSPSKELAIVDAGTHKVLELRRSRGEASMVPFIDLPDDALDPVGIVVSANRVFVADRSSSSVLVFDRNSHQLQSRLAADVPPAMITPLARASLFLLGGGGAQPLSLLDASSSGSVYFIPAMGAN